MLTFLFQARHVASHGYLWLSGFCFQQTVCDFAVHLARTHEFALQGRWFAGIMRQISNYTLMAQ